MDHSLSHALIRTILYPAFYWVGFATVKSLTFGRAIIIPYSELGQEEGAAWWEFRIRRWGYKEWRAESMIIFGGLLVFLLVTGYYACRYLL